MENKLNPKIGEHIIYIDTKRQEHHALVTADWSPNCCNLVCVKNDERSTDEWGRQIERQSSVVHISQNDAKANCWKYPNE